MLQTLGINYYQNTKLGFEVLVPKIVYWQC